MDPGQHLHQHSTVKEKLYRRIGCEKIPGNLCMVFIAHNPDVGLQVNIRRCRSRWTGRRFGCRLIQSR